MQEQGVGIERRCRHANWPEEQATESESEDVSRSSLARQGPATICTVLVDQWLADNSRRRFSAIASNVMHKLLYRNEAQEARSSQEQCSEAKGRGRGAKRSECE